jgi:hypothetical protein
MLIFLGVMSASVICHPAWPRRELDIPQLPELPAHGRFVKRDRKFSVKPLGQIAQAPTHDPMDRRGRTTLHDCYKRLALGIVQFGPSSHSIESGRRHLWFGFVRSFCVIVLFHA